MESREAIVARASAEYAKHLAAWEAAHPRPVRKPGDWFRPSRRISIERQPARYVWRTIHPYVGIVSLQGRLLK